METATTRIGDAVRNYLQNEEKVQIWQDLDDRERGNDCSYLSRFVTKNCVVDIEWYVNEALRSVRVEASASLVIPRGRYSSVSHLLISANGDTKRDGYFTIDPSHGMIKYNVKAYLADGADSLNATFQGILNAAIKGISINYVHLQQMIHRVSGNETVGKDSPTPQSVDAAVAHLLGSGAIESGQLEPKKRGRGRPLKYPRPEAVESSGVEANRNVRAEADNTDVQDPSAPIRRKVGRPRKYNLPE